MSDKPSDRRRVMRKSQLSAQRQWLVEEMQDLGWGWIKHLVVSNREPLPKPAPRKRRRHKLTGPRHRRLEVPTGDFILKEPVMNLFDFMDEFVNGTVMIEVSDGLPADITIE
ncbi:MAG: hypothetical protein NTW87_14345 [Planctomycetota bacterium]|nr:hypothetical protein [Planctomycetota bacterium]